jgi:hypothetical protein
MSIEIVCCNESFTCTVSFWNKIRASVIDSTYDYFIQLHKMNNFIEGTNKFIYMREIKNTFDDVFYYHKNNINHNDTNKFYENKLEYFSYLSNNNFFFVDSLIHFNIGGLFTLCNKSNLEGNYSVGNSFDICQLLKIIKPYFIILEYNLEDDNIVYKSILQIEKVFQESIYRNKIVSIL